MTVTIDQLDGYVERELDADVARWFSKARPVRIAPTVRPAAPFLAKLPPHATASLAAFDDRVRYGALPTMPGLDIVDDWSYGFDFAANDVDVFDAEREKNLTDDVWALGLDGGGNYYVMLTSGRVAVWNHEEDALEDHTQFDSLDVFVWSAVRLAAVHTGVLTKDAIAPDFAALAQPGGLFLLDQLR